MKKVGILTFHNFINYGAILQAYALQKKVGDLGFDAEVIDYTSAITGTSSALSAKDVFFKLLRYTIKPPDIKHLKRRIELLVIKRIEDFLFRRDLEKREKSFNHFRRNYLKISNSSYNRDNIMKAELVYDSVITGSDQVWNPLITQHDLNFFLSFLSNNNKKISYAASFGSCNNIPEEFKLKISKAIEDIKYLSIREASGAEMIRHISNREALVVVDPTLLLTISEWDEIIPQNRIKEPYIFCYAFFDVPEVRRLCKHLSKITGFRIIRLSLYHDSFQRIKEYFDTSTTYVNDSGPLDFLSYFKGASIVVTNSFHGILFSINFKKDFFVIPPLHGAERVFDILKRYNLTNRLSRKEDTLPDKRDIRINYEGVTTVLEGAREKSIGFLRNALNTL